MPESGVFAVRNVKTGECFYGCSRNIGRSWKRIRTLLQAGQHVNFALQEAWEDNGEVGFTCSLVEALDDPGTSRDALNRWIDQVKPNYNVNWWPRFRPRILTSEHDGQVYHSTIMPIQHVRTIVDADTSTPILDSDQHALESPTSGPTRGKRAAQDSATAVSIVQVGRYTVPVFAVDVPLVNASNGTSYIPVDSWCDLLGVRLRTHLWRLRKMGLWTQARELPRVALPLEHADAVLAYRSTTSQPTSDTPQATSRVTPTDRLMDQLPQTSEDLSTANLVWYLPVESFAGFLFCLRLRTLDPQRRAVAEAYLEQEADAESQRLERYSQQHRLYRPTRQRLHQFLSWYEQIQQFIDAANRRGSANLPPVDEAELLIRLEAGRRRIACARNAVVAVLREMEQGAKQEVIITDYYDNVLDQYMEPVDPTIPDLTEVRRSHDDVATWESSLIAWLDERGFLHHDH